MCLIADMETIPQMKSAGTPEKSRLPVLLGAGDERIELPLRVLETPVIPLTNPLYYILFRMQRNTLSDVSLYLQNHI